MAAPTPATRNTPTGYKLPEGFKATIAFSLKPSVQLWEKQVKPPGIDGGEPIVTTTMHNVTWHTMAPRTLKKLDPVTFTAAYDPDCWADVLALINDADGSVTVLYPNNASICFWGYLQKAEAGELKEGEFPEGQFTVVPTNFDPVHQVEAGPVYTPSAGT